MELERLLRSQGFGSRPECRAIVRSGRVNIAGEICDDPYLDVEPTGLTFVVDDVAWAWCEFAYIVLHKPPGYECSHQPRHHPSIYSLLPSPLIARGVQAVGRLDEDTTGLLLLTDDGQFIHRCTSPKKRVTKLYEVHTRHAIDDALIAALLAGVQLNDEPGPIAAAACVHVDERVLHLTVTEGKYHLVKRMVAAASNRVEALHRLAIGGFRLPLDLPCGQWRWLDHVDMESLALRR